MPTVLEQRREVEQARFEAYRLHEEKTDLSERLSLPIENHITLEIQNGQVFGRTIEGQPKRMVTWAEESLNDCLDNPNFQGNNSFEITRRKIELDEARTVEQLVAGGVEGSSMMVISPIPDAVVEGRSTLNGYRRDLKRTMVRLYRFNGQAVDEVTLSLEQSNKPALRHMATEFGLNLPADMQSENILRSWLVTNTTAEQFKDLPRLVREFYDEDLLSQTRKQFRAGSEIINDQYALAHIEQQPDLLEEHFEALHGILKFVEDLDEREYQLEQLRQRTAAAIDLRRFNDIVVGSISDGAVTLHAESNNFGGECPTGSQQSTQDQMGLSQGKGEKIWMNCPFCGLATYGDPCASTIVCDKCLAKVSNGKVVSRGIGRRNALYLQNPSEESTTPKQAPRKQQKVSDDELARVMFGDNVIVRTKPMVGDAKKIVVNKFTGEYIADF